MSTKASDAEKAQIKAIMDRIHKSPRPFGQMEEEVRKLLRAAKAEKPERAAR